MADNAPLPYDVRPGRLPPDYGITPITGNSPTGQLKRYYFNARGVNFVPEVLDFYPFGNRPWVQEAGDTGYSGVNNPMGLFKFFDEDTIDKQLGYIRALGCNSVRIWAGYYAWRHYQSIGQTNVYLSKLGTLQRLLHKNKLHVIWTFWDDIPPVINSDFPTDTSRWSAVNEWVQTPYYTEKTTGFLTSIGFTFFSSVIPVLASSQSTVGYEIGNELNVVKTNDVSSFIISSVKKIYELDSNPRHPIAIGTVALTPYTTTGNPAWIIQHTLFSLPEVKLLTFHPYYLLSSVLEKFMYLAVSASIKYGKPIFITEGGYTINLQPWGRFLQEFTPCSVGFSLYTGIIGAASGHVPYLHNTGLFHANGNVRVLNDALPFYRLALSGSERKPYQVSYPRIQVDYPTNPAGTASSFAVLQGDPKSPYEGQSYISSGYDVEDVLYILSNWSQRTALNSLTGQGNTAILREMLKQTEILNCFISDFILMSDRTLGTYGTSESYGWLTDAQDLVFTGSIYPKFSQINPNTCLAANSCLTSVNSWFFDLQAYDTSFGVIGTYFSGILKGKNYF